MSKPSLLTCEISAPWLPSCSISFGVKLQDAWVGAYWKTETVASDIEDVDWQHVWVCLFPCLPIHISWRKR